MGFRLIDQPKRVVRGDMMRKEKIISRIVKMEERIHNCSRCSEVRVCCYRPSTGKGDLDPDIMIIFSNECDRSWTTLLG